MVTADASTLRPLTLGQILDRALRLYRQNFLTFVGIIAAMLVPIMILQVVLTLLNAPGAVRALEELQNPSPMRNPFELYGTLMSANGTWINLGTSMLLFILVQGVASATLARAIADSYLGEQIDILGAYGKITQIIGTVILVLALLLALYFALSILTLIPCVGWIIGPGVLVFFSYVLQPLIPVVVAIEKQSALGAIRRVWDLTRRRFWWTLGFMFILGILAYVLLLGPAVLINYVLTAGLESGMPSADPVTLYGIRQGLSQLLSMFMQLLYLPIELTAVTLMYFDLRVRTEGFDIAMMAAAKPEGEGEGEGEGETPSSIMAQVPASPSGSLVTSREVAYFAGITLGTVAICGLLYVILFAVIFAALGASSFGP